jgi:DNA-binding NarL/FixJ family response regulator
MDFYNLQEIDHQLLEQSLGLTVGSKEYRDYLRRQFFNIDRMADKKSIVVIEEDPRIQRVMQTLVREENSEAVCVFADSVAELKNILSTNPCDLLVANYYSAEDQIDYEYWEQMRAEYPDMEVVILSHVNDREYYEMLEKLEDENDAPAGFASSKLKQFFENVFGGWYGSH